MSAKRKADDCLFPFMGSSWIMADQSLRSKLIVRGTIAHFVGLGSASFWVAIKLDIFPFMITALEGVVLGAFLASPWAMAMLGIFWFAPHWLERHVVLVCLFGPVIVWASAYLLVLSGRWFPDSYMEPVIIASIVASTVYFALYGRGRRAGAA